MLKNFENWLLENKYSELTSADYAGRIERLCRKEEFTLAHLVENIRFLLMKIYFALFRTRWKTGNGHLVNYIMVINNTYSPV